MNIAAQIPRTQVQATSHGISDDVFDAAVAIRSFVDHIPRLNKRGTRFGGEFKPAGPCEPASVLGQEVLALLEVKPRKSPFTFTINPHDDGTLTASDVFDVATDFINSCPEIIGAVVKVEPDPHTGRPHAHGVGVAVGEVGIDRFLQRLARVLPVRTSIEFQRVGELIGFDKWRLTGNGVELAASLDKWDAYMSKPFGYG